MNPFVIVGAAVAVVLAVVLLYRAVKRGYRGAIRFKNRHASEISTITLTGFA